MKRNSAAAKAAQSHDLHALDERLAREQVLLDRLATARRELDIVARHADRARGAQMERGTKLQDRLWTINHPTQRMREQEGEENLRKETAEINEELARLRQTTSEATRRVEDLKSEIERLQAVDIPACKARTTPEEVVAHQARVAAAAQRVREIDALIEAQEAAIAALSFENLDQYEVMLSELHAARALGELAEDEFAVREGEIIAKLDAAKQANERVHQDASLSHHTIAGLQARRGEAADELAALQALTERVIAHFLRSEMESLGAEYVENATKIRDLFIRAVGLHGLAESYQGAEALLPDSWRESFSLPSLRVRACEGKDHPGSRGLFFSARFGDSNTLWSAAVEAEKQRIRALGVGL